MLQEKKLESPNSCYHLILGCEITAATTKKVRLHKKVYATKECKITSRIDIETSSYIMCYDRRSKSKNGTTNITSLSRLCVTTKRPRLLEQGLHIPSVDKFELAGRLRTAARAHQYTVAARPHHTPSDPAVVPSQS